MKLFVDDIRNVPDDSWMLARTVLTAIRAIDQFRPKEISLDHDISHDHPTGEPSEYPCPETFESVAWYVAAIRDYYPKVTLHTANPEGAIKMVRILENAGIYTVIDPFGGAKLYQS